MKKLFTTSLITIKNILAKVKILFSDPGLMNNIDYVILGVLRRHAKKSVPLLIKFKNYPGVSCFYVPAINKFIISKYLNINESKLNEGKVFENEDTSTLLFVRTNVILCFSNKIVDSTSIFHSMIHEKYEDYFNTVEIDNRAIITIQTLLMTLFNLLKGRIMSIKGLYLTDEVVENSKVNIPTILKFSERNTSVINTKEYYGS